MNHHFAILFLVFQIRNVFLSVLALDFQDYIGEESLQQVIEVQNSRPSDLITINGVLQFDRGNKISKGNYSRVYGGNFNGEEVAVKRVQLLAAVKSREQNKIIEKKLSRLNHPNIVQFKCHEDDVDFR